MDGQNLIFFFSHDLISTDLQILNQLITQFSLQTAKIASIFVFIENQACYLYETLKKIFSTFPDQSQITFYLNKNHFNAFFSNTYSEKDPKLSISSKFVTTDEFLDISSEKVHLSNTRIMRW